MNAAAPKPSGEKSPQGQPFKKIEIGRILSVGASKAVVAINKMVIRNNQLYLAELGTILKVVTRESVVIGVVSSLKIGYVDDEGMGDGCIAQLDILGEITTNKVTKATRFFRGVRSFPVLNEAVYNMSPADLELIFNREDEPCIDIGHLHQDKNITAKVRTDDLLSKHFAIIGSTGSGKSCTVALVLQNILKTNGNAHVVLIDPHNEYSQSFGRLSEVIDGETLDLPLWLFNFEETVELLTSEIEDQSREEQEILHDVILKAKQMFERAKSQTDVSTQSKIADIEKELSRVAPHISLDSPVPYRIRDLLKLLDHHMGKLENSNNLAPYMRLNRRIKTLLADPRYQFIFRNQAAPRPIDDIIGRIFRIPVAGKPISILDMSSIPSESLNIVVSVVSRLAFDLAVWSDRRIPILLVCEEAHRYIPADSTTGFNSTRRSISRIAKEGRKYGVSLGIISQRPSELEPSTLSQCSTIFSMRLTNERDQKFVRAAIPDGAAELLAFLPSLGTAETMIFGESVNMPMRVILNTLSEEYRPHSASAQFTELWAVDYTTPEYMAQVFENWRRRTGNGTGAGDLSAVRAGSTPPRVATPGSSGLEEALASRQRMQAAPPTQAPQTEARKRQSLADVRRVLNSAFHKDLQ